MKNDGTIIPIENQTIEVFLLKEDDFKLRFIFSIYLKNSPNIDNRL